MVIVVLQVDYALKGYSSVGLNKDEGIIPMRNLSKLIHLLPEDVHSIEPLGAVHKMIFRYVQWEAVDRRYVEHVLQSLVVLIVMGGYFSDVGAEIRNMEIHSIAGVDIALIMEEVAAVALDLWDEERQVICYKLVWCEYLCSCTVEVVLFRPR